MTISSRAQLPARSPMPLMVHSTWRAPSMTAARLLATARPRSLWQWTLMTTLSMPRTFFFRCAMAAAYWLGHGVADRVGDVDRGGAGLDGAPRRPRPGNPARCGRRPPARTRCPRCTAVARLHALDGPADDLLLGHLELELAMDGAGGQEDVDARLRAVAQGFTGAVDVGGVAASQAANDRSLHLAGDGLHRLEIARRGDGEAGLDDVDAELRQGVGHLQLLRQVHAGARATARRRAESCRK